MSPFLEADEAGSTPEPAPVAAVPTGDETSDLTAGAGLLWAVDYGESEHRELTTAEIAAELAAGAIDGQTLVWHDNMPDWLAIRDVKELSAYVTAKREPDAPELPKPPSSQQLVSGKTKGLPAAPRATLPFGPPSSQRGPSSSRPPLPPKKARVEPDDQEEVVTSARLIVDPPGAAARPRAPSSPGLPTPPPMPGANPAPSPPAFPPARASQPGPPALPATYVAQAHAAATFEQPAPAAATGSAATGMAAPPMPAPAAAAPMVAPPMAAPAAAPAAPGALLAATSPASPLMAAPPSAPFAPAAASPATADIEWPQARSKKPLIIGAIGLCAVIVVVWLLLSGSDEPSVPPPSNETTQQPASTPEPSPPEPTPPPASTPPEPAPTAAEEPASPLEPPTRPRSQGSTKGGFADMFEEGAKGAR